MNALLWVLQILIALHTAMGAVWKFSHSEHAVPSLKAITHTGWRVASLVELLCSVALVLPALQRALGVLAAIAAACIAAEMLLFCALHVRARDPQRAPMIYWLVVAALCAFLAYGRFVLEPF